MKRLLAVLAAALIATAAQAQNQQFQSGFGPHGLTSPGSVMMCMNKAGFVVPLALCDTWPDVIDRPANANQRAMVVAPSPAGADPCSPSFGRKKSVAIAVASATTTALVAVQGGASIYVCGFVMTIAGSATAATSAAFEYGTGAACTSPTALTGTFGSGDAAASPDGLAVVYGGAGATIFTAPVSTGLCILTAGTTVLTEGVLTYVQQ